MFPQLESLSNRIAGQSPYYILAIVCSAMVLDLANLSAITIALPTVQKNFDVEVGNLQWAISAYALTFGGFLLLGGRAGDMFGHRKVLLFGMTFFAVFTLVCALAPTFISLIVARAFQGIGAASTIPPAQAHIALCFPQPAQKAKAVGIWGAAGSLGFIIGLILGGVLTALLTWRWIFWISLILSAILLPLAYLILPHARLPQSATPPPSAEVDTATEVPPKKEFLISLRERLVRFDTIGISLGVPGILLLTYALTSANTDGWGSAQIIATLIVSVVLLAIFVFHERSAPQAILPPHLFRSLSFNMTLILAVNIYAVRQACTYFLTVQLQSYGNSAIHTSVLFLPQGISALIFNTLSGYLVPFLGARAMFILGWGLSILGSLLFAFVDKDTSYWRFTFPGMILYIAGMVAVYNTANYVVVSSASKKDQGAAAGVFNVALQVGGSVLGLAVLTAISEGMEKRYGDNSLPSGTLGVVGYQSVYYSCVVLCALGFLLSFLVVKVPGGMEGSIWQKKDSVEAQTSSVDSSSNELQDLQ
ncbi:uncharacterized protein K452DRAFT_281717 [Aplosporella prunicola CBS 121167]|uniref:Major facilitator superfamily (MFS) profile domain-containing protein n=1 Tax=Aplosporella prunicola CBS 121167 TaxID=1176127 RepID=A0A6A6AXN3_9PEZI|nr:uncharacterized protein K452DRAFT_281717 [Aplosporella prunicola CBS 121167]KAF2135321.1 hypothetical protein K452DRAFT_281717 [Aplosporella prunicola CBS 121167]